MKPDKNGWIKITVPESLPDDGQKCFVWYEENNLGSNDWCFTEYWNGNFGVEDVTHWRPVFEPPIRRRTSCRQNQSK